MSASKILDGDDLQNMESFKAIEAALMDLIAESSIWVSPDKAPLSPMYPNIKRGAPKDRSKIIDGCQIDDNTYANTAIKRAISSTVKFKNYTVCHVWPGSTYDARYHTLLPNLVLIPRVVAGLSDFSQEVINVLKYRSWELYGWHPEEDAPAKPSCYPENWRDFVSTDEILLPKRKRLHTKNDMTYNDRESLEIDKVKRKVPKWRRNPHQVNSTLLRLYMTLSENDTKGVDKKILKQHFDKESQYPFKSNYDQMKNFGDKNHGKVFEEDENGQIRLWSPVASFIRSKFNK